MAKFDHGGGCACGVYKTCICEDKIEVVEMNKHSKTRMMKPKEEKRYILIREREWESPIILSGQDELIKSFNSNLKSDNDHYYELGPEVEVRVSVSVKTKGTVYRDADVR